MSDVPHVIRTASPIHLRKRLITCINCKPLASSSFVIFVSVLIFPLIFLPTWGRTKASKVSSTCRHSSTLTAPNSMISFIKPFKRRLYVPFHSKSNITKFIQYSDYFLLDFFIRSSFDKIRFLIRIFSGVTSTSSSSLMNSKHCSRLKLL